MLLAATSCSRKHTTESFEIVSLEKVCRCLSLCKDDVGHISVLVLAAFIRFYQLVGLRITL